MSPWLRVLVLLAVLPAAFWWGFFMLGALAHAAVGGAAAWLALPLSLLGVGWLGRALWRWMRASGPGPGPAVGIGALLGGALGFDLGCFGPLLFMPESNQGPLLGILFTGPAGVVLGGVIGGVIGWVRRAAPAPDPNAKPGG